jgi:hypothetical protein
MILPTKEDTVINYSATGVCSISDVPETLRILRQGRRKMFAELLLASASAGRDNKIAFFAAERE